MAGKERVIDLTEAAARAVVRSATTIKEVYESEVVRRGTRTPHDLNLSKTYRAYRRRTPTPSDSQKAWTIHRLEVTPQNDDLNLTATRI